MTAWPASLSLAVAVVVLIAAQAGAQDTPVDLSELNGCGGVVVAFEPCAGCDPEPVFDVGRSWHGLAQCLRDVRTVWNRGGPGQTVAVDGAPAIATLARHQVLAELQRDRVRFVSADGTQRLFAETFGPDLLPLAGFDLVMLVNDRGTPYNAMGQTGLGYFLYALAALAEEGGYPGAEGDAAFFRSIARGMAAVVLTEIAEGGLATRSACDRDPDLTCTWYHSVTRTSLPPGAGATLNQMLHAVRDLGLIAALAEDRGWDEPLDFEAGFAEGVNQLFLSGGYRGQGSAPTLADFVSPVAGPDGLPWAYYGMNSRAKAGEGQYFLKDKAKNCGYHLHVVGLLDAILKRAAEEGHAGAALALADAPGSVPEQFRQTAQTAFSGGALPDPIECPAPMLKRYQSLDDAPED